MFVTPTTKKNVCQRARAVYEDHIRALVEAEHMHEYVAIEPDTGEYEFNEDLAIASQKLKERRPESLTCILRIGHKAAIRMGSGWPSGYKGTPIADSVQYDVFWSRSQEFYEAEIRQWVEPKHNGKFLALHPDTGDCEVHGDMLGAVANLGKRLPGAPFYVLQIGRDDSIIGVIRGPRKG